MANNSVKPVHFSNGKPTPWWRKTAAVSLVVTAAVAALLGLWLYTASNSKPASTGLTPASAEAPDAVQQVLRAGKPTIIEFGANNCVSCREMKPILHALAQDPRIAVADVDILKERGYISKYQIRLMPTQVFYNAQGIETGRHMGKISADDILAHLGMVQPGTLENAATHKATL
jgi:thioredoxin 1